MTETPSTDIATVSGEAGATSIEKIAQLGSGAPLVFSTFAGDTTEDKLKVYDAISDAEPISDHLGETIMLANVVAQVVEVADDKTGELNQAVRVILIDTDGTAYAGLSDGLYRSIVNLFGIVGQPGTWSEPIGVKVVELKSRRGFRFFTIKVA